MEDIKDALFFLVRHGTTKLNEEDKFRGWSDDDTAALDDQGIKQAYIAGHFLRNLSIKNGFKFGYMTSSDLDRATHTAAIIGKILGIKDIYSDPRLRPLNVGDYTGKPKETNSIDEYLEHPEKKFPGGESVDDFVSDRQMLPLAFWPGRNSTRRKKVWKIGHLSNVIYWQDLSKALKGYLKDYASDKEDLIHPGGVIAVEPHERVIPLLGENKKATISDEGGE